MTGNYDTHWVATASASLPMGGVKHGEAIGKARGLAAATRIIRSASRCLLKENGAT